MLKRNQYKSISRLNWTAEEQELLKFLRQNQGIKSWTMISGQLNKVIEGKNRSGKQCRERYMNYVRFAGSTNNSSKWTVQEQKQLFQYFLIDGRKWVQICKKLNGKSQNCLKNRFYGAIRKISRRINKTFKEQKIKQKKILKQQTFIKILETKENSYLDHQNMFSNQNLTQLKNDIVRLAIIPEQDLLPQQIISFTNKVYDYLSHIKPNPGFKKSLKKIEQTKIENQVVELEQIASSLNIYTPKLSGQIPELFQQYENTKFKEERTYLSELGLEFIKYNSSVTYDLDKQVGEILNEDFIQQNLHML